MHVHLIAQIRYTKSLTHVLYKSNAVTLHCDVSAQSYVAACSSIVDTVVPVF